ncbi:MAG: sialate O-acetylesterase, partial [Planctomycetales bacterium]
ARGFLWYQAESNCGDREDPRDYQHKTTALVNGWRKTWGRDLPFYFVQLPRGERYGWSFMRDEQRRALAIPGTGMAVTIDLEFAGIHPPNKIDVGRRLARWALAKDYGLKIPFSGPLYREHKIKNDEITVSFDHADGGLMVGKKEELQPVRETPDAELHGFEVVGKDRKWHAAKATAEGSAVIVSSDQVPSPVAVRYACAPQPTAGKAWNLYNRAGLPASPFCSDPAYWKYDPASAGK